MNNVSDLDAVRASRLIDGYIAARPHIDPEAAQRIRDVISLGYEDVRGKVGLAEYVGAVLGQIAVNEAKSDDQ
jgi:hypothetical protein